ncbi:flagellar basal body-associated protein FliL [Ureibacillus massiliensis 4400831 = CIP 108448 = CCUG 49529]|uniref:Flagellar protein FliL n=1 Tax=Ureibacillus massiliensis 4400831 = CIP 108448 = CCUG 49529 TaxID=1211035 RepID=A0A0A3JA41_9BACL|nr:flagellar basal body-associated protein FliL [Ureibacillus massiliensis]KGR92068.1 flagellar basal body-associated protein FliL [Ureibacillus massiliensis 4400831 = CIP 108448 = CCUG 49529]
MKNNNSNKLLTVMLIILVTITLIGVVIFVLLTQFNNQKAATGEPTIDEILEASIDVPEMTTNLADDSFVRLQLKIQTDSKKAAEELTKRDFQIKDIIIQELSELTEEDLQGKQGKIFLQSTIKTQLNELMQVGTVEQVYITSYIIQ